MPGPDSRPVVQALDRLDRLLAEDVKAAPDPTEATVRARQSMTPARLRGLFNQLESTFRTTPPDTPAGQAALAFHAAQAPGAIARQIDHEMHRREAALAAMQSLRRPLLTGAALVALAAPLVQARCTCWCWARCSAGCGRALPLPRRSRPPTFRTGRAGTTNWG
ncbi:hypothetical protein [Paracoccus mutanolyticus]|uniref:hypothetical protein n=1 Tax=Paracoccus mutanolyticus TaxID=1499308 RepID=UPI001674F3D1|nr:hypothetical protein [Paracoccus mutanolyticus]